MVGLTRRELVVVVGHGGQGTSRHVSGIGRQGGEGKAVALLEHAGCRGSGMGREEEGSAGRGEEALA